MKKISLLILLATFSFAEKIHCLYVTSQVEPFCAIDIRYNSTIGSWTICKSQSYCYSFTALKNINITTGYSLDTTTNTFEIDSNYEQFDVTQSITQPEILKDYIVNPPLKITEPEPTEPEPTEPTEPEPTEPTEPEPTEPTEPEPTEPTPTEPTNPTALYKYGLTFNEFNFLSGLTGLICALIITTSILRKF